MFSIQPLAKNFHFSLSLQINAITLLLRHINVWEKMLRSNRLIEINDQVKLKIGCASPHTSWHASSYLLRPSGQCSEVGASAGWEGSAGAEFWAGAEGTPRGATEGAQGFAGETSWGAQRCDTATPPGAEEPPGASPHPAPGTGESRKYQDVHLHSLQMLLFQHQSQQSAGCEGSVRSSQNLSGGT